MGLVLITYSEWDDAGLGNGTKLNHSIIVSEDTVQDQVNVLKLMGATNIQSSSPFQMVKNWR